MDEYINENQYDKICILEEEGILPAKYKDILHQIRMKRNSVSHHNDIVSEKEANEMIYDAYRLAVWFVEEYCDKELDIPEYRNPAHRESEEVADYRARSYSADKEKSSGIDKFLVIALVLSLLLNVYLLFIK